jgi:hypothetical protein
LHKAIVGVTEEKLVVRELDKRRVFVFFAVPIALAFTVDAIFVESDTFAFALDNYVLVGLSILTLVLVAVWRNKRSLGELRSQHNVIVVLFAIALLFKIYGIIIESGHPDDFGNEIPGFLILVVTVLNRFV